MTRSLATLIAAAWAAAAVAEETAPAASPPDAARPPPASTASPPATPPSAPQKAAPPQSAPPQVAPPQYAPPPPPQYAPPPPPAPTPPQYAPPAPQGGYAPPPPPQYAPPPQRPSTPARRARERDSWYIGLGLGTGAGRLRIGNASYALDDLIGRSGTSTSINFRVGATVTPRLLVGLDAGALAARASNPTEAFQLDYYDAGAMFFPFQRGLFVRAAVGRSALSVESDGPVVAGKATYAGWNALAGAGYAFWLGKAFNLTLNLDYQVHTFNGSGIVEVKRGEGWSAWVGFDWY
jgi:hypothetical protein